MNQITLVGRIGTVGDLETVTFSGGSFNKVKFSVADNSYSKGEKTTTWFNCELSGKHSENFLKFCAKGDTVCVTGSMSSYKSEKNEQTYWTLRATGFDKISGGKAEQNDSTQAFNAGPSQAQSTVNFDDIPF